MYVCDVCNYIFTDKNDEVDIKSEPDETSNVKDSQPETETNNENKVEVSNYTLRRKANKFANYLTLSKHGTTEKKPSKPTTSKERTPKKIFPDESADAATGEAAVKAEEDQATKSNSRVQLRSSTSSNKNTKSNQLNVAKVKPSNFTTGDVSVKSRGRTNLPKTSVKILKTWLFEHQRKAFPAEEEKVKLGQASNLTVRQVNDWFINARRRILPQLVQKQGKHYEEYLTFCAAKVDHGDHGYPTTDTWQQMKVGKPGENPEDEELESTDEDDDDDDYIDIEGDDDEITVMLNDDGMICV